MFNCLFVHTLYVSKYFFLDVPLLHIQLKAIWSTLFISSLYLRPDTIPVHKHDKDYQLRFRNRNQSECWLELSKVFVLPQFAVTISRWKILCCTSTPPSPKYSRVFLHSRTNAFLSRARIPDLTDAMNKNISCTTLNLFLPWLKIKLLILISTLLPSNAAKI